MIDFLNEDDIDYIIEQMRYFNVEYKPDDIINHPFNKYLIYRDNNKQIGFIEYALYYDRIELNYIYVNCDYCNKGIGKKLLEFLIKMYDNKKVQNITLEVLENNYPAIRLYEKLGFKYVSKRKNYCNGVDAMLMIRRFYDENISD